MEDGLIIGSAVTLTDMETFMKNVIKTEPKWKTRVLVEVSLSTFIHGLTLPGTRFIDQNDLN